MTDDAEPREPAIKRLLTHYTEYFGNGEYKFDLLPGHWELLKELERVGGRGLFVLFRDLTAGNAHVTEIREVIRLGLVGGGMVPKDAEGLVKTYFDMSPLSSGMELAINILGSAIYGREPDQSVVSNDPA